MATLELSQPTKTEDLVRLGNGWWELGSKETNISHDQITRHAGAIYSQVLEATTGLQRELLQKRIALVRRSQTVDAPSAKVGPGRSAPLPDSGTSVFLGTWEKFTMQGGQRFTIQSGGKAVSKDINGTWKVKDQKLFITWPDEKDIYEPPQGNTIIGEGSSTRHPAFQAIKSTRVVDPANHE